MNETTPSSRQAVASPSAHKLPSAAEQESEDVLGTGDEGFRILFEQSPDAIFLMDPNHPTVPWRIVACNDVACRMNGYTRDELLGQSIHILDPGQALWIDDATFLDCMRRERTISGITPHRRKDGAIFPIEFSSSLITLGGREFVLGVDRDVTARRAAEMALKQARDELEARVARRTQELLDANAYLRVLAEAIPQQVWTAQPDGALDYVNQRVRDYFGRPTEALLGSGWQTEVHPDDLPLCLERWSTALASGTTYEVEFRLRRAQDGTFRWHLSRAICQRDHRGRIVKWFGTNTDIDDQKRAADAHALLSEVAAVFASSYDYRGALRETARLAVPTFSDWCNVDLAREEGGIERIAACHVDPERVELLSHLHRRYPYDPEGSEPVIRTLRTGRPHFAPTVTEALLGEVAQDEQHLRGLRSLQLRSLICIPLRSRDRIYGVITFATAESEHKFTEDDLWFAEELGRRASLGVENAELYHGLQAALSHRDEFLATAAHELRTPLAGLVGYADLLYRRAERSGAEPREAQSLRTLHEQAQRLRRLVNMLFDLSRIQAGQLMLDRAPLDLVELAGRLVEEMRVMTQSHHLDLSVPAGPLMIVGDEGRLDQAIRNLLENAIKYSPHGGSISITVSRTDADARVAVRDEGIGIPAAAQPQLFSRYYRAANTGAHGIAGMGIGLYLVKEIVTRHGGTITLQSVEGQGSTFILSVPLPAVVPDTTTLGSPPPPK